MKSKKPMTAFVFMVMSIPAATTLALYDAVSLSTLFTYVAVCATLGLLTLLFNE